MQRKFSLLFWVWLISIFSSSTVMAQKTGQLITPPPVVVKKPIVKTYLGSAQGIMNLSADEASKLIVLPLKITDDKNNSYLLSSYQFAYKRKGVTEDEVTGKISPQSDLVSDRFSSTPLPLVWQKNITDGLHTGEELYFFDIIVSNDKGIRLFAPEIKITIL
jgi:hypothetical protein